MITSKKNQNVEQRFLRDEEVSAKTLETSMRHRSENAESGRIWSNSENSSRYLNSTENLWGGGTPQACLSEAQD